MRHGLIGASVAIGLRGAFLSIVSVILFFQVGAGQATADSQGSYDRWLSEISRDGFDFLSGCSRNDCFLAVFKAGSDSLAVCLRDNKSDRYAGGMDITLVSPEDKELVASSKDALVRKVTHIPMPGVTATRSVIDGWLFRFANNDIPASFFVVVKIATKDGGGIDEQLRHYVAVGPVKPELHLVPQRSRSVDLTIEGPASSEANKLFMMVVKVRSGESVPLHNVKVVIIPCGEIEVKRSGPDISADGGSFVWKIPRLDPMAEVRNEVHVTTPFAGFSSQSVILCFVDGRLAVTSTKALSVPAK